MQARGRFDGGGRLERCLRPRPHRPPPVTHEAMQRMRKRLGDVRLEPVRRGVVLDVGGHARVIVALDGMRQHEGAAESRERDEQQRSERSAPSPKPGQHSGSRVPSGNEGCQGAARSHTRSPAGAGSWIPRVIVCLCQKSLFL